MKVPSLVWLQGPWSPVGYSVVEVAEEKVPARARWEQEQSWRSWTPAGQRRTVGRYDANATGRITISLISGGSREGRAVSLG